MSIVKAAATVEVIAEAAVPIIIVGAVGYGAYLLFSLLKSGVGTNPLSWLSNLLPDLSGLSALDPANWYTYSAGNVVGSGSTGKGSSGGGTGGGGGGGF